MGHYQIYLFALFGLLIATRLFANRQFYKLSDEDKLKLLAISRKPNKIAYIFYGIVMVVYLAAIYVLDADAIIATNALMIVLFTFIIFFAISNTRRLKAENIVIPHYRLLLGFRLLIYAVLFSGVFFYLHERSHELVDTDAYEMLEQARHKWEKGDNRGAVEICSALIAKDSTVSVYYVNRGVYRYNAGDTAGAFNDWQHSIMMGDSTALKYMRR